MNCPGAHVRDSLIIANNPRSYPFSDEPVRLTAGAFASEPFSAHSGCMLTSTRMLPTTNYKLYRGDNLQILRDHIPAAHSVGLARLTVMEH
jgi:hypothetical protein